MPPVSDDDIRWLLALAEEESLAVIEVQSGDTEVLVRMPTMQAAVPVGVECAEAAAALPENVVPLLSPMAGVFYRAPSPESTPFVEIGDEVRAGDPVALIEAMKLFNEVPSPINGTVVKFLVEDQEQVEAEEQLLLIEVREP